MNTAAQSRIRRFLPLVILTGLIFPAFPMAAGVNVWTTNGPEGGDIWALAIDPANPAKLYAGTYGGGVFKSTDSGGTWTAANTGLTSLYVYTLAIDPSTPTSIYAGTHGGVFKSIDSGSTWVAVNTGLMDLYVTALAIDPAVPATLYAGTYVGAFKSTNSGITWASANTGLASPYIDALAIDPAAPATLYAGTAGPQVFKSTDSGGNWGRTGGGPNDPWGYGDVFALAIDPATPATLYAGTDYGLFKSSDRGGSWTAINTDLMSTVMALAIDPANPATLYAGTRGGGVFRSTDAGASWTATNAGLTNLLVYALAVDPSTPSRIYAGTGGGGVHEYRTVELTIERRIFPVVGSTPGANGTFFRTSVQLNNPGSAPSTGRIVFHPSGAAGSENDPSLSYTLAPGQTQSIADLLPAMGHSGIGSADIEITSGAVPVVSARVFNDAGSAGTTGFTEDAMRADEAIYPGQSGVLVIPSDFTHFRFNVGVRTLAAGASATFTVRNASGAEVGSSSRSFPSSYHEQANAVEFLGSSEVPAGGSITVFVTSGSAIVYGGTVDNRTGDPSFQVARFSSPWAY
jgi:photosystem II stability/assembly factor-like uncharacterized protein